MLMQLVFLVICHTIFADPLPKPSYDVENYEVVGHHFEKFIKTHQKIYSHKEKATRFEIFVENLKEINRLNEKHQLATFDIGKFTDLTKNEQGLFLGFVKEGSDLGDCKLLEDPVTNDAPVAWDWRDKNVVSPVGDQRNCGACWAFSATSLVESRYLQKGKQVKLSVQQMVDCDTKSHSCSGGYMVTGLSAIMKEGGQESEADYPYTATFEACRFDSSKIAAKVTNCTGYSLTGEGALKELLFKEGPLAIGVQAASWSGYKSGIYEECDFVSVDHGALLVGYGSEGGEDFWVIKNSMGADWGEQGYIRIKRGVKCCGIGSKDPTATVSANVA